MASPSTSLATLRPDLARSLEQFDLAMDRRGFVGMQCVVPLPVYAAGGNYGIIPLEQLLQNRTAKRTDSGDYQRGQFTFQANLTFATQEYGLEERVDDNQSAVYAAYFDQERIAAARSYDGVLRARDSGRDDHAGHRHIYRRCDGHVWCSCLEQFEQQHAGRRHADLEAGLLEQLRHVAQRNGHRHAVVQHAQAQSAVYQRDEIQRPERPATRQGDRGDDGRMARYR